jgi:DNA-binding MarR family transcriptional regulator
MRTHRHRTHERRGVAAAAPTVPVGCANSITQSPGRCPRPCECPNRARLLENANLQARREYSHSRGRRSWSRQGEARVQGGVRVSQRRRPTRGPLEASQRRQQTVREALPPAWRKRPGAVPAEHTEHPIVAGSSAIAPAEARRFAEPLTASQLHAIELLVDEERRSGGGLSLSELSVRMNLGHSTVSGIVDRLEQRKFLRRHVRPDDRRYTEIELTPQVKRWLERNLPPHGCNS